MRFESARRNAKRASDAGSEGTRGRKMKMHMDGFENRTGPTLFDTGLNKLYDFCQVNTFDKLHPNPKRTELVHIVSVLLMAASGAQSGTM